MDADRRTDPVRSTVRALRAEATATDERRLVVLSGDRAAGVDAARAALDAVDPAGTVVSVSEDRIVGERVDPSGTAALLGTTHECVVFDGHAAPIPNALGRAVGTVEGGGLCVLLAPPISEWPEADGPLERLLAAPPFSTDSVGTRFKRRLVRTLRSHAGIAIIDVDAGRIVADGTTDPAPRRRADTWTRPETAAFPAAVYAACRTADQRDAVRACETLADSGRAVVLRSDRGRGKSSAGGLAAAALAAGGADVLVTAPAFRNAAEVFSRASETLETLGALSETRKEARASALRTDAGGAVRFRTPQRAIEDGADVLLVDEAATLPVRRLEALLSVAPAACFMTTVRGYEGTGRGFDVRFRDRLETARTVTTVTLSEPIRHAPADPIEVWLFHALLLGATPAAPPLVDGVSPAETVYERLDREELAADEPKLAEAFGLLVAAHYRTEPNDLARLLDAPNVAVRALTVGGHVASVALLGREGGLDERTRRVAYEGDRIEGNLVPDLLTSQLRDPEAAAPTGLRVMRIATHRAARSSGLGSRLLAEIRDEFRPGGDGRPGRLGTVDYLATSYGVTPPLCRFWRENGYRSVHLSATRNEASGEHSVVMLDPLSPAGRDLADRHGEWFRRRLPGALGGPLSALDSDVVRAVIGATAGSVTVSLSDFEWRLVASAVDGPGQYGIAPAAFRRLAFATLLDGWADDETERLLTTKVLQARAWDETADALGFPSERACMRALGDAFGPIVETYGPAVAREELERYRDPT